MAKYEKARKLKEHGVTTFAQMAAWKKADVVAADLGGVPARGADSGLRPGVATAGWIQQGAP